MIDEPPLPEPPRLKRGEKPSLEPFQRHGTIDDKRGSSSSYSSLVNPNGSESDAPKPPEFNTDALKNINVSSNALKNLLSKVSTPKPDMPNEGGGGDGPSGPKPNLLEVQQNRPRVGIPNRPRGRAGIPIMPYKSLPTEIPTLESASAPIPQTPPSGSQPIPSLNYGVPPPVFTPSPYSYPPSTPPVPPPYMGYPPMGGAPFGYPSGPPPPLPAEEDPPQAERKVIDYSGRDTKTPEKEPEVKKAQIVDYTEADYSGPGRSPDMSDRRRSPTRSTMPDRLKVAHKSHSTFSYDTFRRDSLDKLPSPPPSRASQGGSKERHRSDSKDRYRSGDRKSSTRRRSRSRSRDRSGRSRDRRSRSRDRYRRRRSPY